MTGKKVFLGALGTASPAFSISQNKAAEFLHEHFSKKLTPRNMAVMEKLFNHPSISERKFAFDDPMCLISESPDDRIKRFTEKAVELSKKAAEKAMLEAGISVSEVSGIIVNTCTGYICPGLSTYLIGELGLARNSRAYDLVGSGCGGAIPNLELAKNILMENGGAVLSISVEICSATFQMGNDIGLILSNALFADGAAAALLWTRPEGLQIFYSASSYSPEHREAIRYVHRNGELHNQLSPGLPRLVRDEAARLVQDILQRACVPIERLKFWALHPGGEKIINYIREALGLSEAQVEASRKVLKNYGNMSSPTVLFVLRELMDRGIGQDELCLLLTFGAGLSAHGMLLKKV